MKLKFLLLLLIASCDADSCLNEMEYCMKMCGSRGVTRFSNAYKSGECVCGSAMNVDGGQ